MTIDAANRRLATYGTLAPGRPNAHLLADLSGRWAEGTVRGRLHEAGWGAKMGFPGLVLEETAGEVAVQLFESDDLPAHWERLDAFEGSGYRRVPVIVRTRAGDLAASIYVLAVPG